MRNIMQPIMKHQSEKDLLLLSVGQRVRGLRQERGLTVNELAARASLSPRFINQIEAGEANISIVKLAQVAAALGQVLPDLLTPSLQAHSLRARTWRLLNQCDDKDWRALHDWLARRQGVAAPAQFVALIGLRGAGKSTVGPMLAKRLKTEFIELDQAVEEAAGLSLAEIFTTHGEPYFQKLEREALQKLLTTSAGCVFAPGGSVVSDSASWNLIKHHCVTVWLHATPKEFMQRMLKAGETRLTSRPTVMTDMKALLARREPLYAESEIIIKTTGKTPAAVATAILQALPSNT
jgi:XRE family transcriptional regulator, aerobic/anaerobic benzoate catabolism transcriptional regulator